jgi:hypothetical protein
MSSIAQDKAGTNVSYATWLDDNKPWVALVIETITFNANASESIHARGCSS